MSRRHLSVTFPFIPHSAKNGTMRKKIRGRVLTVKSNEAHRDQMSIAAIVRGMGIKLGQTWAGSAYVGVEITVNEGAKQTTVTIHDLGPPPAKGRKDTVRDVHGVVESVMDGLQGHAFDDDRQVRWCRVAYSGWEDR